MCRRLIAQDYAVSLRRNAATLLPLEEMVRNDAPLSELARQAEIILLSLRTPRS